MSEGRYAPEIEKLNRIDRFGVEAVTGRRVLYLGELNRMIVSENIVSAYHSRQQSKNWGEWALANPGPSKLLAEAIKLHAISDPG